MPEMDAKARFVNELIALQPRLRAYIYAQLADWSAADDVLQQTNMVLWSKSDEAAGVDSLKAWAYRVAQLEVMGYRKKRGRDRHRFDDTLLDRIAQAAAAKVETIDDRRAALETCLAGLNDDQRVMLNMRYGIDAELHTPAAIAERLGRPVGSIRQTLYRVRSVLMECIERRVRSGGAA